MQPIRTGWLVGVLCVVLAGCGGGSTDQSTGDNGTGTGAASSGASASGSSSSGTTSGSSSSGSSSSSSSGSSGGSSSSSGSDSSSSGGTSSGSSSGSSSGGDSSGSSGGATPAGHTDVTTFKNDVQRTGADRTETVLTPANVNPAQFGLLRILPVDGKIDAQPLYLAQLAIDGMAHNVLYVATEHDTVFAFDVDTGAVLWQQSLLGSAETSSDARGSIEVTPEIGITATPVIDRTAGALFVVAMSKDSGGGYHQRIHALDLLTGAERGGSPVEIQASYPIESGMITFDPAQYKERAALLLLNGVVYTTWSSHADQAPYTGWVIGYDESTLAQVSVLNLAPNSGGLGPAIWMSGGGPSADAAGDIYLITANGVFDDTLDAANFPSAQDYGDSFVRLSVTGNVLKVADYFTVKDQAAYAAADEDLGSSDALILPDFTDGSGTVRQLLVGGGKDGNLYLLDRSQMGGYSAVANNVWQELAGAVPLGIYSTPAYFNDMVYYGDKGGTLKAFAISSALLSAAPVSQTAGTFHYPGTSPAVSANGTADAIVWAAENAPGNSVLHAYSATDLAVELYNSSQAADGRDNFGAETKFLPPTIADGKVFMGATDAVGVFGLLP